MGYWVKSACEKQILSNQLNFLLGHCDKNNRSRELDRQNIVYPDFAQDLVAVPHNIEEKIQLGCHLSLFRTLINDCLIYLKMTGNWNTGQVWRLDRSTVIKSKPNCDRTDLNNILSFFFF